jgi:pimeloyl-ACP methyl ester carboxylesterase
VSEQFCEVGHGITLCYETFGSASDPTALLIMGLGTQMVAWQDDFCAELAQRGFHVVRFDNRDIGRSTLMSGRPPSVGQLLLRSKRAGRYTLADMAQDSANLLSELELAPAHVIGASMGGMIAQTLAARHPQSVRSLVSIMSSTGSRRNGQPSLRLYPMFLRRAPRDRDAYVAHMVGVFEAIGSRTLPRDHEELRNLAALSYDRGHDASGPGRQLGAIIASGDRTNEVRGIEAPTLVVHGTADPLVAPSGGRATARTIRGAELMEIDGMGHDLPRAVWPELIDAIAAHAQRADADAERRPPLQTRLPHAGRSAGVGSPSPLISPSETSMDGGWARAARPLNASACSRTSSSARGRAQASAGRDGSANGDMASVHEGREPCAARYSQRFSSPYNLHPLSHSPSCTTPCFRFAPLSYSELDNRFKRVLPKRQAPRHHTGHRAFRHLAPCVAFTVSLHA